MRLPPLRACSARLHGNIGCSFQLIASIPVHRLRRLFTTRLGSLYIISVGKLVARTKIAARTTVAAGAGSGSRARKRAGTGGCLLVSCTNYNIEDKAPSVASRVPAGGAAVVVVAAVVGRHLPTNQNQPCDNTSGNELTLSSSSSSLSPTTVSRSWSRGISVSSAKAVVT